MVRREQAGAAADDPVSVGVGVGREGEIVAIAKIDEARHRVRRRRVHADGAVPVDGHESKRWINGLVHNRQVEAVSFCDARPIIDASASKWVHAQLHVGVPDRRHIDDAFKIFDIGVQVVVSVGCRGAEGFRE